MSYAGDDLLPLSAVYYLVFSNGSTAGRAWVSIAAFPVWA